MGFCFQSRCLFNIQAAFKKIQEDLDPLQNITLGALNPNTKPDIALIAKLMQIPLPVLRQIAIVQTGFETVGMVSEFLFGKLGVNLLHRCSPFLLKSIYLK